MFKYDSTLIASDNPIGNGPQSCVYPYLDDANEGQWVVKCLNVTHSEEVNNILRNIFLSSSSNHPGLVPVKDYDVQNDQDGHTSIYIKMPRIKESLQDIIRYYQASEDKMIPLEKIVGYLYCIATSLDELAQKRTAHRNIKPTNILIDAEGSVFLSDLKMHQTADGIKSSSDDSHYRAPEVNLEGWALNEEALHKADAWSVGIVIAEACLIDTFKPISSNLSVQEKREIFEENLAEIRRKYSKDLVDIIRGLLTINAKDREDFSTVSKLLEKRFPDIVRNWGKENEEESLALIQRNDLEDKKRLAPMDLEDSLLGSKNVPKLIAMKKWILSHKLLLLVISIAIILAATFASIFIPRHFAAVAALKKENFFILMQEMKLKKTGGVFEIDFHENGFLCIFVAEIDGRLTKHQQQIIEDGLIVFINDLVAELEAQDVIDQATGLLIKFYSWNHITDFGFETLAQRMTHFKNLEGFIIERALGTKPGIMNFISIMSKNFPDIDCFGIDLHGDGSGVSEYTIFEDFPNLQTLFVGFIDMNTEELALFASKISEQGKSLTWLRTRLAETTRNRYNDSTLETFNTRFFSGLKNLTNLNRLELEYQDTSLATEGWNNVTAALSTNGHQLKSLAILFNHETHRDYYDRLYFKFNESILTSFAHALAQERLSNLEDLVLDIDPCSIKEETRHIIEQELNYIPRLRIISQS